MTINSKHTSIKILTFFGLSILLLSGCDHVSARFERIDPSASGVLFRNELKETPELNIFNYLYYYNGGGVGVGDFNSDGLPDLYFTANQAPNRLYLNEGDFKFEDVTDVAGVAGPSGPESWITGVSVVDINADGLLDIYVSAVGSYLRIQGRNFLYINQGVNDDGVPVFIEEAAKYGLDLIGFSTQAAFFDYDQDGDLDMYMLNHSVHSNGTFGRSELRDETHPLAGDRFFKNEDGKFTDVTEEVGIYSSALGYGLGITVSDINMDGYPDVYIGNDFHENDYLYINNTDGTFSDQLQQSMQHTGRFSMGNDIADINNDGLADILSLDMLPKDYEKLKTSAGEDAYPVYNYKLKFGYAHQFARNTLQLNMGNGKFSEIGMLAGVHATDWSWSGLLADFDLNGYNDIFVGNGIKGRTNDLDYITFISNDAIQHRLTGDMSESELALTDKMPVVKIPNYVYSNEGNFQFKDVSKDWGLEVNSFSNGAAYADLDRDGDLDLVINNINEEAFIFRNNTIEGGDKRRFLNIKLKGNKANPFGIGTRVIVTSDSVQYTRELYPVRGYLSSMDYILSFGLGTATTVDSVTVIWPDRSYQVLKEVKTNQILAIDKSDASGQYTGIASPTDSLLVDVTTDLGVFMTHVENDFVEFNREQLIPHMISAEGPALAVGDINGDELEDFFVGGAKQKKAYLFFQTTSSQFVPAAQPAIDQDSIFEDVSAVMIDADGDGDLDLIVASGGNEYRGKSEYNQPRLYLNDGGTLRKKVDAFEGIFLNASVVVPADYDQDGDTDLFVGARSVQWNYGLTPESYLLQNDGTGSFRIAAGTPEGLTKAGMVTDAEWNDLDKDGFPELIVVGEWEPVKVFKNDKGKLTQLLNAGFDNLSGWWSAVRIADVNGDGYPDIVAGNLGLNSKLKADEAHPLTLFVGDFDDNGKTDPILCYYEEDQLRLFPTRDEVNKQIVALKKRYTDYSGFASAGFYDLLSREKLKTAQKLYATELRSCIFLNDGNLGFTRVALPVEAQFSPINELVLVDIDGDGKREILGGGNKFRVNIQRGRYDASYGIILKSVADSLIFLPNKQSGFYLEGEIRQMSPIMIGDKEHLIVARNNDILKIFSVNKK